MNKFHAIDYKAFYMMHVQVSGNHYSVVVSMLGSVVNGFAPPQRWGFSKKINIGSQGLKVVLGNVMESKASQHGINITH